MYEHLNTEEEIQIEMKKLQEMRKAESKGKSFGEVLVIHAKFEFRLKKLAERYCLITGENIMDLFD